MRNKPYSGKVSKVQGRGSKPVAHPKIPIPLIAY
jgi:hypothetical protein